MEDVSENLVITIWDEVDEVLPHTPYVDRDGLYGDLEQLVFRYGAISTGNQLGAGSTEFFFSLPSDKIASLKIALQQNLDPLVWEHMEVEGML